MLMRRSGSPPRRAVSRDRQVLGHQSRVRLVHLSLSRGGGHVGGSSSPGRFLVVFTC